MLTPELMVRAYASGYFPMADSEEDGAVYWYRPKLRTVIPIVGLHVPRRLQRTLRSGRFESRFNAEFEAVVRACADREEGTWLSEEIIQVFLELHGLGRAYCMSVYREGRLVGGIYGMMLGRAFFAESMFHRHRDASKVALVELVNWLRERSFLLLDAQFMTDHLRQFGAYEVEDTQYEELLNRALRLGADADPLVAQLLG